MSSKPLKILVDETSDGLDIKLQNAGYYAESVKKLRNKNEKMGHDYNVIQYAKENDMVFITKDKENGKVSWTELLEKVDHDELVYKLSLKYLRVDGFDIGNSKIPEIKKFTHA